MARTQLGSGSRGRMVRRAVLGSLVLLAGGFGWVLASLPNPQDDRTVAWVAQRVQALDMTEQERAWEQVGFSTDLPQALELARQHDRPIFFFAMAGELDGRT